MTKRLSYEIQGKSLVLTVADGRTEQKWTIRQTHSAEDKASSLTAAAQALSPEEVLSAVAKLPTIEDGVFVPRQGPVPAPLVPSEYLSTEGKFRSRYEPSQGVPTPIPENYDEAQSLENLKEYAWKMAQSGLGLVKEGAQSDISIEDLPEVSPDGKGGIPMGMPQLMPVTTGSSDHPMTPRVRPNVNDPHFRYKDTV